eukprot:19892-Heterococcus_DN1.PRE.1
MAITHAISVRMENTVSDTMQQQATSVASQAEIASSIAQIRAITTVQSQSLTMTDVHNPS